jgi:hypothetical protein
MDAAQASFKNGCVKTPGRVFALAQNGKEEEGVHICGDSERHCSGMLRCYFENWNCHTDLTPTDSSICRVLEAIEKERKPMYARVITAQVQPGKIDEAVSIYRNTVVPAARRQKGFKGISLLIDRNTGEHLRIVIWGTEAETTGDEAIGLLHEQIGEMASTFAGPPITEHCEVSAHV